MSKRRKITKAEAYALSFLVKRGLLKVELS